MSSRRLSLSTVLCLTAVALAACKQQASKPVPLPTVDVVRGDIDVRVQATGTVQPIDPVDVKSKAGGEVIKMPVDVGSVVKKGQVLTVVDPRDVKNKFDQAVADDVVTQASLTQATQDEARTNALFAHHVITTAEHDSSLATLAAAKANLVEARANVDLARQALEDATVEAPFGGTIVARPVTQGMIITPATAANGGTTLMTLADLSLVRMQVTVDEVEMANVRVGEHASVIVDAFPDRQFSGTVEKVEPQAVVTQGVTFFPVLVTIDNREGLLMPGMNGEVTIQASNLKQVVQIPIDATRPTTELAPVARMFNIPIDSLLNNLRRDLVGQGESGVPGRYVVVAQPNGSYEMRLIKTGPTDLRVVQVTDGIKEGDKVIDLGAVMTSRPAISPALQIASDMRRGAPVPSSAKASASSKDSAAAPQPTETVARAASSSKAGRVTQAAKP